MKRHTPKTRQHKPARRPVKITPESTLTPYDVNAAAIDVGIECDPRRKAKTSMFGDRSGR